MKNTSVDYEFVFVEFLLHIRNCITQCTFFRP